MAFGAGNHPIFITLIIRSGHKIHFAKYLLGFPVSSCLFKYLDFTRSVTAKEKGKATGIITNLT
jgi:hypothetical protein